MYGTDKPRKINPDFLACVFIILAVFVYFYKTVFFKDNFFIGDIYTQFFPWKNFLKQSIENRAVPFWNPFVFSGMPYLADIQKGAFYPLGIVFYFLDFSPALKIYVLAHFVIMGVSIYFLLRAFNFSPLPSIAGSFVFLFNSFTVTKIDFLSALGALAFLPLIILVFKKFLAEKKVVYWVLFICLLALSFLSGHPPVFIYTLLLLSAFWLYHLSATKEFRFSWPYIMKILLFFLISSFAFALLVLPQLGLFLELMKNSSRMAGLDYRAVSAYSVSFENLLAFMMPAGIKGVDMNYLTDWLSYAMGTMNFFTITALFLVTVSFFYPKNRLYVWSALVLCAGLLMAMGRNTPVYSWFFTFIPFFSAMRHPAFAMTLVILPFAIMAAFSLENINFINEVQLSLFDKLTPFSRVSSYFSLKFSSRLFKVFLFMVLVFALVILNRLQLMKVYGMDYPVFLKFIYGCLVFFLIFGFNIALFFFKEKGRISTGFYSVILVFFMFFESLYFISGINPVVGNKIYDTASLSIPAVSMVKSNNYKIMHTDAADRDRVIPGTSVFDSDKNFFMQIPSNTGMLFEISEAGGYDALELKSYHDFMSGIFRDDEILDPASLIY